MNLDDLFNEDENDGKRRSIKPIRPRTLLEAFECITTLAENSHLDERFMNEAKPYIGYICRKLKFKPMQAIFMAILIDKSEDHCIRPSEIAKFLDLRTTRMLRLQNDIKTLGDLHYIRLRTGERISYRVPGDVLEAIKDDKPYEYKMPVIQSVDDFFSAFADLLTEKGNDELDQEQLFTRTFDYLKLIDKTHFAKKLRNYPLSSDERMVLIMMCHLFLANDDDDIRFSDLEDIFNGDKMPRGLQRDMTGRTTDLFHVKLIENVEEDGFLSNHRFKLTDATKEDLLSEVYVPHKARRDNDLIRHDSFSAKKLIYNPREKTQIDELTSMLSAERFSDIQKRLADAGMRKGFCCLFYGAPGTGKTETVYQLARLTGRNIMRVDVDQVKSCWVGESEKNIKKLFDNYRRVCEQSDVAPILLFNEADAVLGIRMEGATRAVEKMENSIQNIILQEMESLEGIMIATTNLTTNLDSAFERRFLYKVKYDKPTREACSAIWRSMLPSVSDEVAGRLAEKFDLSGGEIENISRKHTVRSILSGNDDSSFDAIAELCSDERIKSSSKRVGF